MNAKKLEKIFKYYKRKHKLDTTIDVYSLGVLAHYKGAENYIFLGLKYIDEHSGDLALRSGYITLKELYIFTLLHEIKHAIDYTYHQELIKSERKNLHLGKYLDSREYHHQQPFEIRADAFAKQELGRWLK